eukprot:CAMPEP_0172543510 /NCGR_PEP_ID=MMETSP1067-20121228/13882_1 /TAXON_ID=265564 ORGANISM="Thalassiosira punctigera, Strain Tpunct2005C2" /NCGR_SAMPLE_ID=MMETSP1067 /ASSEMBLY_ACC=CAM_ASM_000444 /LENGTH=824 /DNA_ID=CAMNT_0013329939 /DNA_START=341 /DNA_END=2815 /DNA_ORIENTATION=+
MTTHVEAFLWGTFAQVQSALFGQDDHINPDDHLYGDEWNRRLGGGGGDAGGHSLGAQATHITYQDLYASIMFFACIYVGGQIAARLLRMPSLVGEIFVGIALGPNLAGYVPFPISFVMLGEIGLILLVIEAGIDIDLTTLKLIGSRGMIIAIIGSVLPIALAFVIALAIGTDIPGSIAAGACFGPTSLGIAMNILRQGKIVNTPVGQLIVSAAVIDDMIALIILSQLGALTGEASVATIVIPIVSALGFLIIGGIFAVTALPKFLNRFFFAKIKKENHGSAGLGLMFLILFAMMPATYYAKSSFLMGAFLSGLVFCRNHDVHVRFVSQFKRLLQWLMRIFFAASIGFQVPIKDFGDGMVIAYGLLFTLALTGKLVVGFLVPNFNNALRFKGLHLRDCLITGCSMAAEGEFAFVIAVFSKDQGLISPDLYASIVLAVLISTIIPPFALRFTISKFNNIAERMVKEAELVEQRRASVIDESAVLTPEDQEKRMKENIKANKIVFLCIQIQCASTWGLIPKIISTLTSLKVEVIDNRSWHPRGVDSTLMTEIFVQDDFFLNLPDEESDAKSIEDRVEEVNEAMKKAIRQPGAKVQVTRWFPGVLQSIVEEVKSKSSESKTLVGENRASVRDILAHEASKTLESKRNIQIAATKEKTLEEIKKEMGIPQDESPAAGTDAAGTGAPTKTRRRVRQKMRSTPVVGGSLFDDPKSAAPEKPEAENGGLARPGHIEPFSAGQLGGQSAELVVGGEVFKIRIMPQTVHRIRSGYSGEMLDDASVKFSQEDVPIEHRLQGFIRTGGMQMISEDVVETETNHGSETAGPEGNGEW